MLHIIHFIIKYKAGLLNLVEELNNISNACKIMSISHDIFIVTSGILLIFLTFGCN